MRINTKATDIVLTPELTDYLDKRLQSIGKVVDHSNPTLMLDVELGRTTKHHQSGDIFRAEINLHIGGNSYRAVAERQDLNSAIDAAKDEIVSGISKEKKKHISFIKRSGQNIKNAIKNLNPWNKIR
jgi:ribosomal subunit interface protein